MVRKDSVVEAADWMLRVDTNASRSERTSWMGRSDETSAAKGELVGLGQQRE